MRIAILASEGAPYIKSGGLGDVMEALPAALARIPGNEVVLILPYYKKIKDNPSYELEQVAQFHVSLGWRNQYAGIYALRNRADGVQVYFVDNNYYFGGREGAIYGAIEGYYGGAVDLVMERVSDVLSGVPFMVVTTLFQLHLAKKVGVVPSLLFAFILTGWIGMASTVRMQFYRFKGQEYILAARTLGASDARLMFKHIFPNSLGTIITSSVLVIPGVIFSESSLTYLGIVNLDSSTMTSVGTMLANGRQFLASYPHIIFFPAIFISLLEISFNLFGNGLRDAFNPALRGSDE